MKMLNNVLMLCLLSSPMVYADEQDNTHKIHFVMDLECPMSEELEALLATMPAPETSPDAENYDEWAAGCLHSMLQMIQLIVTGKTYNSSYQITHTIQNEDPFLETAN